MALSKEERNKRKKECEQRRRDKLKAEKEAKEAKEAAVEEKRLKTNSNNRASYARRQQKRKNEQDMATPRNNAGQQHHPAAATMTPRTPFPGVETPANGYPSYSTSTVRVAPHMTPKRQFATMRVEALASIAKSNLSMAEAQRTMAESQCAMAESNLIAAKELETLEWEEEEESQDDNMSPMRNFVETLDSLDSESPPPEDTLPRDAALPANLESNEESQVVAAAVRTVTPEPFLLDKWSFKSQEEFDAFVPQFLSKFDVLVRDDPHGGTKLLFRFLSFLLVEYETYFDSLFNDPPCAHAQYLLTGMQVTSGIQLKHGVNRYIKAFQKGSRVMYRSLDGQGNLIGLVEVEIVAVDGSVRGAFTINHEGNEISTMIDRLQPIEAIPPHGELFG